VILTDGRRDTGRASARDRQLVPALPPVGNPLPPLHRFKIGILVLESPRGETQV
jgi:hypothetical protein